MSRKSKKAIETLVEKGVVCSQIAYWRAATSRLEVARFLRSNSVYQLDAIHLAGYSAECSLKALILNRTPESNWAGLCEEISSGSKAHNFDYLARTLKLQIGSLPADIVASLNQIGRGWTTNLRYEAVVISRRECGSILSQVATVYEWVERSISWPIGPKSRPKRPR